MMLQQADGLFLWATSDLVNSRTVGIGEGVGIGVTTIVGEGVGIGASTGEGVTRTDTPRLQTRFFPRLTQVNSLFFETTIFPTFLHVAPARGAFADALGSEPKIRKAESMKTKTRRICEF
jgi:hypothetical protein